MKVTEYVSPEVFEKWRITALDMGFLYVASGPLVRSSYKAGEAFIENVLKKRAAENAERIARLGKVNSVEVVAELEKTAQ